MTPTITSPRVNPVYVNEPQRSAGWHQARLGNLTGSEGKKVVIPQIGLDEINALYRKVRGIYAVNAKVKASEDYQEFIAENPFKLFSDNQVEIPKPTTWDAKVKALVAERLTGLPAEPEQFTTYDMKWGTIMEPLAIAKYSLLTNNPVTEAPLLLHPDLRCGASPDGFVIDRATGLLGVLECKCLRSSNHLYNVIKTGEVPEEYLVQIHMEIWISGRDFCDFIAYDQRVGDGLDIFVKRVWRDEDYIENILEPQIMEFLNAVDSDERLFRMLMRKYKTERPIFLGDPTEAINVS